MATIGKVSAIYTANTSGLVSGTAAAGSAFKRLMGDVSGLQSSMRTLVAIQGAQLFGSIASAASSAARSFVGMAQGQAETIDKTSKLSRQLGLTYGELAGLALAGDLAGVSMETIGKAATKSDVAFVKAAQGSKVAQAAFAGIGLSVDQLQNKSPAERFQMIADAIGGLPTPAERARAAIQLFGKSGSELLPLFEGGAGSIAAAVEEANKFGLALTNEQGMAVENMNDAFTRAYASIQGVVQQVVAYLAPAIQGVADAFTNFIGNVGGATIGQTIGDGIISGAMMLASVADSMMNGLMAVWEYAGAIGTAWNTVFEFGFRFASFLAGVGRAIELGLQAAFLGITGTVETVVAAVRDAAAMVGLQSTTLDSSIAAMAAFNNSVVDSMGSTAALGSENMDAAFGSGAGGAGTQGPLVSFLSDALLKAKANALATNRSEKATVGGVAGGGGADTVSTIIEAREAIKGIDSRSKDGIAEMYRIMRGDGGKSVAEQQLEEQKKTNALLSDEPIEDIAEIAG